MAKVVTEKPRRGHGNSNEKHGGRLSKDDVWAACDDDDLGPLAQSTSAIKAWSRHRNHDYKEFSDLIGPLQRYLRKQVGRRWDDVYSELSAQLDKRSLTGAHIWGHIRQEIETQTWMGVSGRIYARRRFGGDYEIDGLYVHPFTGVVCYKVERRFRYANGPRDLYSRLCGFGFDLRHDDGEPAVIMRRYYRSAREAPPPDKRPKFVAADWRVVDDLTVLQRINGAWFIHQFKRYDPMEIVGTTSVTHGDVVEEFPVYRHQRPKEPTKWNIGKRQLGKREIKQYAAYVNGTARMK